MPIFDNPCEFYRILVRSPSAQYTLPRTFLEARIKSWNKPIKQFIADTFGSFSPSDDAKTRWETANRLIGELGGNALNIASFEQGTNRPLWLLSSMSEQWLEKYTDEKMFEIDPFIPHLMATNKPFILDTHKTVNSQPLNAMLREAGYSFLYGLPFNGIRSGERQIITYCSNLPYATLKKATSWPVSGCWRSFW